MSPESRARVGMVRPERVAEVCFQVHACFAPSEQSNSMVPLLHTMALLTLHRFDRLPPHRQSLAAIASNITGALERLCRLDRRLEGITAGWRFGYNSEEQPYDPRAIRQAIYYITALRPIEPRTFASGVALYVASIELAKRGLPQNVPLLAYRLLQPPPWASLLEAGNAHSALLWNIAALLGTFSPPGPATIRFTIADCDNRSEALVRMLAAMAEAPPPIGVVESLSLLAQSPLKFDRIIAIAETATDGYLELCHQLLHAGGKAVVMIPTPQVGRWWQQQLSDALSNDRIEAIIEWSPPHSSSGWTFVLLRTTAPIHRRRRVLSGKLEGTLSIEHVEEITDALDRGTTDAGWLSWQSLPAAGTMHSLPIQAPMKHTPTLHHTLRRWSDRGLDVSFLTAGNNGSLRFDERITSRSMLRTAIYSSQNFRMQEMRYHYTIYQWWQRIAPLLSVHGRMLWQTVEDSLVEHLSSVPLLSVSQARALAIEWWHAVAPDIIAAELYGGRAVVESILNGVDRKMRTAGVKLWKELDEREEFVVALCVPHLYQQVRLERQRQVQQRSEEAHQLDMRITALQAELTACRTRMAQLHAQAKAHDVPHDSPELLDSTLPLQNELSELLKKMVVIQSELKMLQQNRTQVVTSGDAENWFSPVVARCTAQLLPALQNVRRSLTDERAWAILLHLWEDHLHRLADAVWEQLGKSVCDEFEHHWEPEHASEENGVLTLPSYARASG